MISNYKIKVNIEIVECSEETQAEPHQKGHGVVEFVISEQQGCNIDECEKALLQANFPALRDVLSDHLTILSKKKACEKGSDCRINEVPYRVDGEVGRFSFNTHSTTTQSGTVLDTSKHFFSPLKGKEWYRTQGFKEVAIVHGTVERSYRETHSLINRYQPEATPLRTLSDSTESEGEQLQSHIDKFSADRKIGF